MTDTELHDLLSAANPLPAERARGFELTEADSELLAAVVAEPRFERTRARPARRPRRRVLARAGAAIAATAAVLVVLLSLRDGSSDSGSGIAWAAEQIRFAEASPLVLLDAPGWRVVYADEQSRQEGELQYRRGPEVPPPGIGLVSPDDPVVPIPADTDQADLNWRGGPIREWYEDRAASATVTTTAPVLGTTARVYQYEGGTPGHRDITALFRYDGRVLEFRAGAADIHAFRVLLAKLKRVDTDTWLSAMPPSVVKTPDRDSTIRQMLRGVPLPPGFEREDIEGAELTKDRYQLGAAVAGTVACQWFKRWAEARSANDRAKEREAVAAMATARSWPVLHEMQKQGGYPDVLLEYAAAMPRGEWYGRPLIGDVKGGLGCAGLGVKLP
jgi:hypothetical protein